MQGLPSILYSFLSEFNTFISTESLMLDYVYQLIRLSYLVLVFSCENVNILANIRKVMGVIL